jgi:hypothetical protein
MKTRICYFFTLLILILCLAVPAMAAEVAQGKCIKYDTDKNSLVIEEYDTNFSPEHKYGRPTGKQAVFDVSHALIGILPHPGDILRIAYDVKGNDKIGLKVMNVSKQDIMKK